MFLSRIRKTYLMYLRVRERETASELYLRGNLLIQLHIVSPFASRAERQTETKTATKAPHAVLMVNLIRKPVSTFTTGKSHGLRGHLNMDTVTQKERDYSQTASNNIGNRLAIIYKRFIF